MNFSLPIVLKFAGDGQEGEFTGLGARGTAIGTATPSPAAHSPRAWPP